MLPTNVPEADTRKLVHPVRVISNKAIMICLATFSSQF